MKAGDYYKLVGSYEGVAWIAAERRWARFQCECCARYMHIAVNRKQGPFTELAWKAVHGPIEFHHDIEVHKAYIAEDRAKKQLAKS